MVTNNSPALMQKRAYSVTEFCRTFNVSRTKTFRLLADGTLTRLKLGSKTLIRVDEAEAWFASLQTSEKPHQ